MNISVSLLASYLYCPRKIFLERVLKFLEPPKEALVKGTVKHEIFDMINKKEKEIVESITEKPDFEKLEELYKKAYSEILKTTVIKYRERLKEFEVNINEYIKKTYPLIMNEAQTRALNVFEFIEKHNLLGKELWEKLTPKIHSEFRIKSDTLGLSGIIDQLEIYEKGYVPVELKTGRPPKEDVWDNHKIQVGAYAMLLEEKYNTDVKEGFIYYIDVGIKRHIAINIFLKDEINQLKDKVTKLLENLQIPDFCDNKNKCKSCGLKDTCFDENKLKKRLKEIIEEQKQQETQKTLD